MNIGLIIPLNYYQRQIKILSQYVLRVDLITFLIFLETLKE